MISILAPRRSSKRGLTLIEILIALIILMVGLVGIFALFPVGIRSTQESVQDTNAALIAESFHHTLIAAMRLSRPAANAGDRVPVCFCHDGTPGMCFNGSTSYDDATGTAGSGSPLPDNTYVFQLPSTNDAGTLFTFPTANTGTTQPPPATPRGALWKMGGGGTNGPSYPRLCLMGNTGTNTQNPVAGTVWSEDSTESLNQYCVSFDVSRVPDQNNQYTQPLFEFQIGVYRNYQDRSSQGWPINANPPGGAPMNWQTLDHPDRVKVFRTLIAGN